MPTLNIISEEPITMAELSASLEKIKKRDGELNFRANKTQEYLEQLTLLKHKQAKELVEKISSIGVPRLKPEHAVKITDVCPTSIEELKTLMSGYNLTISQENYKKIVDAVVEYAPKKK